MTDEELWALESLGHFHLVHERYTLAQEVFEALAAQWPNRPYPHYALGLIAVAQKADAPAVQHFADARARHDEPRYALAQAQALARLGQTDAAREIARHIADRQTPEGKRARALIARWSGGEAQR